MIFAYSGGLHHVLAPGDSYPKILKDIPISLETVKVNDYIANFLTEEGSIDRKALFKDLERRRDRYCVPLLATK